MSVYQKADRQYRKAKNNLALLQETWYKGQTAILAGGLTPGVLCLVRVTPEHPLPRSAS